MKYERVWCAYCGKETAGRVPAGGDGTFQFPRRHKNATGQLCEGRFDEAYYEPPGKDWTPHNGTGLTP